MLPMSWISSWNVMDSLSWALFSFEDRGCMGSVEDAKVVSLKVDNCRLGRKDFLSLFSMYALHSSPKMWINMNNIIIMFLCVHLNTDWMKISKLLKVSPSKMIQVMVMVGEDCDAKYQVTTSVASWSVSRWTTSDCHTRIHLYCTKHIHIFILWRYLDILIFALLLVSILRDFRLSTSAWYLEAFRSWALQMLAHVMEGQMA